MAQGIYKITNKVNSKIYIGSTNNFSRRKREHFRSIEKLRGNSILRNAINKYGKDNFIFEIIEETSDLLEREQHYIDLLNPQYNIRVKAESNRGIRIINIEVLNHLKRVGFQKGHKSFRNFKEIYQVNKEGKLIKTWSSSIEAITKLKLSTGSISRVISGKYSHTKGLIFTNIKPM